ncbi:MAG: 3-deoxy-manno-octulosonate cytidylyltransferase, partial [candidate division Zixibacteria bacterium]|nr:3-deoxy-manno-octulosonate cytidylyltransferase [candidate division Zixibacteria bacterium]
MSFKTVGVIPARMESKRFYGKVLYPYKGKPLLYYIYNEVSKAKKVDRFVVATDSQEIESAVREFGAEVIRTSGRCKTGSDRVAAVMQEIPADLYINVQADLFGLKSAVLDRVIMDFSRDSKLKYGTLARKIRNDRELKDPNSVKVVLKKNKEAGWFSRQPLPYLQSALKKTLSSQAYYYYHIGVYFYRRSALKEFAGWQQTPCEKA